MFLTGLLRFVLPYAYGLQVSQRKDAYREIGLNRWLLDQDHPKSSRYMF